MWKEYSRSFIRENRALSISLIVAAFISSLFLSLLCSLAYNVWIYEMGRNTVMEPTPLVLSFSMVVFLVSVSLILIIHNAFAVSMNARVHQIGIFSSVGATPKQIVICLLQEAIVLCTIPIFAGIGSGILISFGMIGAINEVAEGVAGRQEAVWHLSPMVFGITVMVSAGTVLISAWMPARQLSKMTALQAIRNTEEHNLKKKTNSPFLSLLFGIEGELAGNALKAQKRSLRTSALSLTLSCLGFTVMLCFLTLSSISTNHTYFERYQNVWDVMATIKGCSLSELTADQGIQELQTVEGCVIYQKAEAFMRLPKSSIYEEVNALEGLGFTVSEDDYIVKSPIIILDDGSFLQYAKELGVTPDLSGSIVLNRIWDHVNSNFRYKKYIPFIKEGKGGVSIQTEQGVFMPVLAMTQMPPILREEYENHTLVQFVSYSFWERYGKQIGITEGDCHIRVLAEDRTSLAVLDGIQADISSILEGRYAFAIENRLREKLQNDNMLRGYRICIGGACVLLALIGVANVFSNTLGFLRQRKREFARYMSIGMTEMDLKKMFFVEVCVIAGKPILVTLVATVLIVSFMIKVSYLAPMEFWMQAPVLPIIAFMLFVAGFVALAYYIGGRKVLQMDIAEALRDDTI